MAFMQDDAPIHIARIIENWFCEHGIPFLDWPPYSPDLNYRTCLGKAKRTHIFASSRTRVIWRNQRAIERAIFQGHGGFLRESRPGFL